MINFSLIKNLQKHFKYLAKILGNKNIFLVGGSIRDILLSIDENPIDIDITLSGNPNEIFQKINSNNISIFKTDKYGTITIIPHEIEKEKIIGKNNKSKLQYEITPFRSEGKYEDFRHPGEIEWTNDIILDSQRRDFTINSLYYTFQSIQELNIKNTISIKDNESLNKILNEKGIIYIIESNTMIFSNKVIIENIFKNGIFNNNNFLKYINNITYITIGKNEIKDNNDIIKKQTVNMIIDSHNGISDIINKKIKCVGQADNRFGEDSLRIIRGIRFVVVLNEKLKENNGTHYFDFENETRRSMKKNYLLVNYIAKERIKIEIEKAIKSNNSFGFFALLDELNLLKSLFPGLYNAKKNDQPTRYHSFDTYSHSLLSLYFLQEINNDYLLKLGTIYHDVGKPDQYYYIGLGLDENERKKLYGSKNHHTKLGVEITENDFKNLGFSKKEINKICWLVKMHMIPGEILNSNPEKIENKLKKLLSEYSFNDINNLIDLAIADRKGQFNPIGFGPEVDGLINLKEILKNIIKKQGEFKLKNMVINGNDIMKEFNLKPGPIIGNKIKKAFERVLEEPNSRNNFESIIYYLKNNGENNEE